jgi:MbtH protein
MSTHDQHAETLYEVAINEEEQYSIWPTDKAVPLGWKTVGHRDLKASCLEHIKLVWVDMRPLSLRQQMAQSQN